MAGKRVLVADASETIIAVCRKLLSQHGYESALFQDGNEKALEELKNNDYDLAVIATTTQNVSGYFIVKELRQDRRKMKMPVLMLLGSSELLDTHELVDVAPEETLNKPFSPNDLIQRIDRLIKASDGETDDTHDGKFDIESILNDDDRSFEKKIADSTDKILLSAITQQKVGEGNQDAPRLDKLDLSEDQYNLESVVTETSHAEESPHDYDWFVREMRGEPPPPKPAPTVPTGATGKFLVDEIGTSKIPLEQLRKMKSAGEAEKTKVYIEKLHEPFVSEHSHGTPSMHDSAPRDFKTEFVRRLAEALAVEIAKQIDIDKILAKLSSETAKLGEK